MNNKVSRLIFGSLGLCSFIVLGERAAAQSAAANLNGSSSLNNSTTNRGNGPDGDWAALQALIASVTPKANVPAQNPKARQADVYRQSSAGAKAFYNAYPTDIRAGEAKKLEVEAALLGVTDDDKIQEQTAQQLAVIYRGDKTNSASDRFEIAALSERVQYRAALGGIFGNAPGVLKSIADRLLAAYPGQSEAYQFYASVARAADSTVAPAMAGTLVQAKDAPADVKSEAQVVLNRSSLLGHPVTTTLQTINGTKVDLAAMSGKVTIFYVWRFGAEPAVLHPLVAAKDTISAPGVQIVYLALGASIDELKSKNLVLPIAGPLCAAAKGTDVDDVLWVRHTPFIYVIDREAKLRSFGPAATLSAQLTAVQ